MRPIFCLVVILSLLVALQRIKAPCYHLQSHGGMLVHVMVECVVIVCAVHLLARSSNTHLHRYPVVHRSVVASVALAGSSALLLCPSIISSHWGLLLKLQIQGIVADGSKSSSIRHLMSLHCSCRPTSMQAARDKEVHVSPFVYKNEDESEDEGDGLFGGKSTAEAQTGLSEEAWHTR